MNEVSFYIISIFVNVIYVLVFLGLIFAKINIDNKTIYIKGDRIYE
jgi:hypothetical protein